MSRCSRRTCKLTSQTAELEAELEVELEVELEAELAAELEALPPNYLTQRTIQAQTSQNMTNIFIFLQSLFMLFVIYQNICL